MNAVFLVERKEVISKVYDEDTLSELDKRLDWNRDMVSSSELDAKQAELAGVEYAFSTWGMLPLTQEQIAKYLPNLKAVFYGAGSVQYFARPFLDSGVKVYSAWGANAVPVAEYAVAQIILAGKGFYQAMGKYRETSLEARKAQRTYCDTFPGNYSTKIGILGVGMIGRMVLERLQPYQFELLAYDPFVSDEALAKLNARRASLDEIFSTCQTISNHIANLPATVGMLNYDCFSKMLPNATFINTARGAQVVEPDLIRALTERPDRTAVLDVTYPEPPEEASLFHSLPNVILTPHIAGSMNAECARMGRYMLDELTRLQSGEDTLYEVTPKMLETMA